LLTLSPCGDTSIAVVTGWFAHLPLTLFHGTFPFPFVIVFVVFVDDSIGFELLHYSTALYFYFFKLFIA
jgi:hypothetical protein